MTTFKLIKTNQYCFESLETIINIIKIVKNSGQLNLYFMHWNKTKNKSELKSLLFIL